MRVPSGWKEVALRDVGDTLTGRTPPTASPEYYGGDIPFVQPSHLQDRPIGTTERTISSKGREKAKLAPAGSILTSCIGNLGRTGLTQCESAFNQQINALVPSQGIDSGFAFYQCQTIRPYLESVASATTVSIVNKTKFSKAPFLVAPEKEQHRIVAKIEEFFSELDAGVAALERAQANLERYRAAVLKAAVEGKLTDGTPCPAFTEANWVPLAKVIQGLSQGWSPRCEKDPIGDSGAWGVIKTSAVQRGSFAAVKNKRLPAHLKPRPDLELAVGDLLITRAGPRSRVGVTCLVTKVHPRLMLCDKVYRVRVNPCMVRASWLELVLNSPQLLMRLDQIKSGISDSGLNLTQGRFKELRVPLPDLESQVKVEGRVSMALSLCDALTETLRIGKARSGSLRQSILKRAFSGRLVPQDPNDEPASVLLERIRAEREASRKVR